MNLYRGGFTLPEMLVAIAAFALFSVMGQQVTDALFRAASVSGEQEQQLQELRRTMQLLAYDFTQMVRCDSDSMALARPEPREAIRFVRGGLPNPQMALPRSHLIQVAYRIHQQRLERLSWPQKDAPPVVQPLLPAHGLLLQFYDGNTWLAQWHAREEMPQAIKLQLETPAFGAIERTWLISAPRLMAGGAQ